MPRRLVLLGRLLRKGAGGRADGLALRRTPLLRNQALNQPYERWLAMMWPSVCRTVHSPPPGSASQSAADEPASAPWSSQRATAIACERRDRRSDRLRRTAPAPRPVAIAAIADFEPLVDAIEAVADVELVDVGRQPAPAALERVVGDGQEVGDDGGQRRPGRDDGRVERDRPGRSRGRSGGRASAKRIARRLASA